ncbi:methionine--tRNA ligase [Candidatus Mycoplasma haematominutum]|uniref:Methionine--tRNA ligase n=1 Tax=Candidatus Mycoplasma haematominutum 'Birmingham 1' TaxID=1116213 RepID=G8C3X6_9MOLU|nr:methionine--tRNA ligase [Candidatus Mycoplasma haematominutum]CCE67024.1 methionyl-tRNA synthetase [Candidatus Mycoplasma haematominutum 'Birmingham 1']
MLYDVLVTTPLFYSSGDPHIGHAYTLIIGDLIKKYYALIGKKAYLLCGVDEHGEKISKRADELHMSPDEFVSKTSAKFRKLWERLDISPDAFVRTTDSEHQQLVLSVFESLMDAGKIYLSNWKGYNCVSCETNYSEQYYSHSQVCEMGHKLQSRTESAYFLKLQDATTWLTKHYNSAEIIIPEYYLKNLTQNFLNKLEDLSITRKNLQWGIKLKDEAFTIYVWFEALICYFSNSAIRKMWEVNSKTKIIQVLGKEIVRFHSIYLPVILKSQNLKLPEKLLVHGWLLNHDRKISKSEMKTNPIMPLTEILNTLHLESIKWFFSFLNWTDDHPFDIKLVKQLFNKYVVNLLGNLINRLKGILAKNENSTSFINGEIKHVEIKEEWQKGTILLNNLETWVTELKITSIIHEIVNLLEKANKMVEKIEPWKLSVESGDYKELNVYLYRQLALSAYLLSPIFGNAKWQILKQSLSIKNSIDSVINLDYWNSIQNFSNISLPPITNLFEKYS